MTPTQPDFLDMPFAANGGRNTIPASGEEEDGNATLDQGFPIITEQPISQGGIPPRRKDFNGILYALSNFCFFAQSGGVFTYDTTLNYRSPALVWHNNNFWICIKANGPDSTVVTPGTDSSYWKDFIEFLGLGSEGDIVANRLGTSTVGSGTKHIYLDSGSPKASGSTVGGTAQGMWLNAGTMQAMSATVGSATNGIWLDAGILKACTGSGGGISEYKLATAGYVKFEMGLIIQWGNRATTGSTKSGAVEYTVTFPTKFTSGCSYVIVKNMKTPHGGGANERDVSFWSKTASTAVTRGSCSHYTEYTEEEEWLAIGY